MKINKEYKILSVKNGVSSKGNNYTILSIKENKKNPNAQNGWDTIFYKLFIGDKVETTVDSMITIKCIKELEYTEKQIGDKTYRDCTIFLQPEGFTISGGAANGSANQTTPFDDLEPAPANFKAPWD